MHEDRKRQTVLLAIEGAMGLADDHGAEATAGVLELGDQLSSERVPRRSAVAGAASLGTPIGTGMLNSLVGEIIAIAEAVVAITVIAVALPRQQDSERTRRLAPMGGPTGSRSTSRSRRTCLRLWGTRWPTCALHSTTSLTSWHVTTSAP